MKHFRLLLIATMAITVMDFSATANKVVDIIAESENHTILETAIVESNLEDDLRGAGPFTIFAPTDAAFQALPEGTIDALLADSRGTLTDILLYHVLSGKVMSTDLSDNLTAETYNGEKIQVKINGSGVYINNALVTVVDLEAENGVVHVIDAVLLSSPDVQVRETEEYGSILSDTYGNSLYFFTRDADGSSKCVGGCLNNWPVFYSENPELGEGLDASDFGVIDRGDGTMQTTYKGWPLYYFVNDTLPSEINGEGVIGKWFVAKPDYTIMIVDNQLTGNDGINYQGDYTPGDEVIQYFTDAEGLTLYTWKNDNYNINNFTDEAFAKNSIWPIYEKENIVLPSILDPADFKVINVFGRSQLTFKGWPLYYFGQDNMERGSNKGVSVPSPGVWPVPVQDMMEAPKIPTVVDIVVNSEDHTTLEAAVVAAGLVETLQGDGPFTVFAPTDAAFAALPEGTVEALLADIPALTNILTYHVVGGKAMSSDLSDGQKIITVQGKKITVTINEDGVFINNAKVTVADIEADNGLVHVIDAVLIPSALPSTVVDIVVNSEDHTTLEAAVVAAGLVETLQGDGPFTVFAPTDAAFAALPEGTVEALLADIPALTNILTYHVVGGKAMSSDLSDGQKIITVQGKKITVTINKDGVFINNAKVTVADIEADNGVVHVIDAVLIPSALPSTVVDIVVNSEDHTTLEAAVVAAGLVETLQGDGPFTVFAPTDATFAALPEGTVEALLADIPALTDILTYHVVGGKAMSKDLSDGQMIATVNGKEIEMTINEEGVFINNAKVTVADIEADNGVVHVIDAVLIPETLPATVVDIATSNDDFSILVQALTREDLTIDFVGALTGEGPFTVFAPTNAAFVALLAELGATSLDDIETETLEAVLQMHVLEGKVMSTDLSEGLKAQTLLGQELTFSLEGGAKIIDPNGRVSNIVAVDIEAQNGVVHVIDKVILVDLTPTSVTNLEQISFDFYPNPANVYITVRTDEIGSSLRIMDISGKLMHAEQIWNSSQRVDLNGVKTGVYFISIEGEGKRAIQKLIVR